MNKTEVRLSQDILLELLVKYHTFCVENRLTYYIIGGTLLGAVRHGGFIPWDIDVDVAMPRIDYEEFLSLVDNNLSNEYFIQNIYTEENFHTPKTKIIVKGAKKDNPKKYIVNSLTGLNLDIFPLDYAPENIYNQKKQRIIIKFYKTLLRFKIKYVVEANGCFENLKKNIRTFLRVILKPISQKHIVFNMTEVMTKYNQVKSPYLCSMASHYDYNKQVMKKEIYGKGKLIEFEGHQFVAPDMIDEYLKQIYGDYMKVPPKDKQEAMYRELELILDDWIKAKYKES